MALKKVSMFMKLLIKSSQEMYLIINVYVRCKLKYELMI